MRSMRSWAVLTAAIPASSRRPGHVLMQVAVSNLTKVASEGIVPDATPDVTDVSASLSSLPCSASLALNESFDMNAECPASCPYHAIDQRDGMPSCSASCVVASQCMLYNPDAPVPDQASGTCRGALVDGCHRPKLDGTDGCLECSPWYRLTAENQCQLAHLWVAQLIAVLLGALLLALLAYVLHLHLRPLSNLQGLNAGLAARSRQKYRDSSGDLWPLCTNLCRTEVGGPGLLLHFNFLAGVTIWALVVALGWLLLAYAVDIELLILGRRSYGTAYRNCVLVAWGYVTQQRLMWAKLVYLAIVYLGTFVACLCHGRRQRRLFKASHVRDTMKAFAALVKGLPEISAAEENVEAELAHVVSSLTGQSVIGASVCWSFGHAKVHVDELLRQDAPGAETVPSGWLTQSLYRAERLLLQLLRERPKRPKETTPRVVELLRRVTSSSEAYLVFETRAGRDRALAALSSGFSFRGSHMTMAAARHQPRSIHWQNYDRAQPLKWWKLCKGLGCILAGLITWACVFYLPFAWSILTFNYEGGRQPGLFYSFAFSIIVVIGNVSMYQICASVADNVGFKYKETREACYMILYFISVSLNVLLDLAMTYYMSFAIMVHLGFRTHDGVPLTQLPYFVQRFEAYAIQRAMGQNLYDYAFPSTFLLPFLGEPAILGGLLWLGMLMVRSHPELSERAATSLLAAQDYEFGRYADTLLNVFLAVAMFFFPGGYTHWIFFMLALSQAFIYALDHWRVLRVVPASTFASMQIDWWCQVLLAPCCGLLAACLVFKGNCHLGFCLRHSHLLLACVAAWLGHCVLHLLMLTFVVPLGDPPSPARGPPLCYQQVAATEACSWFSGNPVHCLRSKHVHRHRPSCSFFPAQEASMEVNEAIGCFFSAKSVEAEDASTFQPGWSFAFPSALMSLTTKADHGT